ncbi:unnamed protein product [Closterium sp. Naga37s-1]|nr:unnamed protein product [Closterium sp. Naga37s-1]
MPYVFVDHAPACRPFHPLLTWQARLCVEGQRQLYAFCEDRGVPHRRVGKLVVATSADQVPQLEKLKASSTALPCCHAPMPPPPCCMPPCPHAVCPHAAKLQHPFMLQPSPSPPCSLTPNARFSDSPFPLLLKFSHLSPSSAVPPDPRMEGNGVEGLRITHAEGNGVEGLQMVGREEASRMEPRVECQAALLSPHTGIVDSHTLMLALQAEAEAAGAVFAFNSAAVGIQANPADRFPLLTTIRTSSPTSSRSTATTTTITSSSSSSSSSSSTRTTLLCSRYLVNAAGLEAVPLAHRTHLTEAPIKPQLPPLRLPPLYLARGHYFAHSGPPPFSRLVYPLPEPGGLGVHATVDLAGRVRFGPDVQWLHAVPLSAAHGMPVSYDYSVDPARAEAFYSAIRKYFPTLQGGSLHADYAGIRPKLTAPGDPAADFLIQTHATHGMPGLIHLLGIESPGLTSCLAIAKYVRSLL